MATRSAATARCGPAGRPASALPLAPRPGSSGICGSGGGGWRAGGVAARVHSTWSTGSCGGGSGVDSAESYFESVERRRVAEVRAQEPPPPPPEDPFAAYRSVPSFWDTVGSPTADAPPPLQQQQHRAQQQRDQERDQQPDQERMQQDHQRRRQQQEQQHMQQQRQEQQRIQQEQQLAAQPASGASDGPALVGGLEASGPVAAAMQALQGAYGGQSSPPPQPTPWGGRADAPSAATTEKHDEEEEDEEEGAGGGGGFFTSHFQAALQAALSRSDDEDPGPPAMPGPGPNSTVPPPTPLAPVRPADREVSKTVATLEEALAGSHMTLSRLQLVAGEVKRLMDREKLQVQRLEFALEKAQADDAYYTTLRRMQEAGVNSDWE